MAAIINSLLGTNRQRPRLAVPAGSRLILSIFYKDTTIYQENRLNVSSKFYMHIKFFYVHNILIYVIISYKKDHFDKHLIVSIWTHTRSYLSPSMNCIIFYIYIYALRNIFMQSFFMRYAGGGIIRYYRVAQFP